MTTKLVTLRLPEDVVSKIDQFAEAMDRQFNQDLAGAPIQWEDGPSRKWNRSDVLRGVILRWLRDNEATIEEMLADS